MRKCRHVLLSIAVVLLATHSGAADTVRLTVAEIDLPSLGCMPSDACQPNGATTTTSDLPLPGLANPGTARVRTRTLGLPPIAQFVHVGGITPYLYRIDLSDAAGSIECVAGLVVNFGPSLKVPRKIGIGTLTDTVDVLFAGEGRDVGLRSASRDEDVITFELEKLLCAGDRSVYFGLASSRSPAPKTGGVFAVGDPPFFEVKIRAPGH